MSHPEGAQTPSITRDNSGSSSDSSDGSNGSRSSTIEDEQIDESDSPANSSVDCEADGAVPDVEAGDTMLVVSDTPA